jgi:hypothetical protein
MRYPRYITKRGKPEVDWRVVNILTDEEYNDRISSKLLTVNSKSPVGCYLQGNYGTGWEVPVSDITQVRLTYLRLPVTPVFAYAIVNDQVVYNVAGSTQLEYPVTCHPDFVIALCRYVGIYLNAPEIWQMLGARAKEGQA